MNSWMQMVVLTSAFGLIVFTPNDTEALFNAFKQGAKKAGEAAGRAAGNVMNPANANAGRGQMANHAKDDLKEQIKDGLSAKPPPPPIRANTITIPAAPSVPQALPPKRSNTFGPIKKAKPEGPVTSALKAKGGFGSGSR